MQVTQQEDLSNLIQQTQDLPSFPAAVQRATALANDPKASAADLAKLIEVDPVLTARILRVTNSAFYGLSRQISTAKEAVVVLGFSAVRSLAVAVSTMKMFKVSNSRLFNHRRFWLHSTCCALVAQQLCRLGRLPWADEVFTAGLLHDIGKIVLHQYANESFLSLLSTQKAEKKLDIETERKSINTDHAQVGQQLAERWRLPVALCEAIGLHHQPIGAGEHTRFAILCGLADYICTANEISSVVNGGRPPDLSHFLPLLEVSPRIIREVNAGFPGILKEARSLIKTT